jgi:hypothetical protein
MQRNNQQSNLSEGLEQGDLKRLIHTEMHLDEFKSKLGQDKDVSVISFKARGKDPALDLVNFCEKGYDWVLDADASSGEMDDGDYIVFVEIERTKELPGRIMDMMKDIMNLTDQQLSDWRVRYRSNVKDHDLTEETLASLLPLTPEEYDRRYGKEELDKLKNAAGIEVKTKAPKNDYTESLRALAGITL